MANVNLDALIPREDFAIDRTPDDGAEAQKGLTVKLFELQDAQLFYSALRKPDFQRETTEWSPDRVKGLIQTFVDGDLIPGLILWRNRDLIFVIDGSHRLSALIAWVQDDYGDGTRSRLFFQNVIPEDQLRVAEKTRKLVHKSIGPYRDHVAAGREPDKYGPEMVARARRIAATSLQLQWVSGDAVKAEDSFKRINQQAAMILPQELELINLRRRPKTIAARAIIRKGTGHQYWSSFAEKEQAQIRELATEVHDLIFVPPTSSPATASDLSAGGPVYSGTALRMVYDFVALCVGPQPKEEDDRTGLKTIEYLTRARRIMQLLLSKQPNSLGLHPAVYFYSWTGKHQPLQLLTVADFAIRLERNHRLPVFTRLREKFESFLINNRPMLQQIVRKYGTTSSGRERVLGYYEDIMQCLEGGTEPDGVAAALIAKGSYNYLQPEESPFAATGKFSSRVKTGTVLRARVDAAVRCSICRGLVPNQAVSIDHMTRREEGGSKTAENASVTHPYCNTGFKESKRGKGA